MISQNEAAVVIGLGIVSIWLNDLFFFVLRFIARHHPKFATKMIKSLTKTEDE